MSNLSSHDSLEPLSAHYPFGMRIAGRIAKGLSIALILTLLPVMAFSAQKISVGSACKIYKQKVNYQNKIFTCIKSNKKLVWGKGVTFKSPPTPTPTTTPTPTPTPTPSTTSDQVISGLYEQSYDGYFADNLDFFKKQSLSAVTIKKLDLQENHSGTFQFSKQWTGFFVPDETGIWTLTVTSDDSSNLWLGAPAVTLDKISSAFISLPGVHAPKTVTKSASVTLGINYPIRAVYGNDINFAQMTLVLKSPSGKIYSDLNNLFEHSEVTSQNIDGIFPIRGKFTSWQTPASAPTSSLPQISLINDSRITSKANDQKIDFCKIVDLIPSPPRKPWISMGFPRPSILLPTNRPLRVLAIPISFPDKKFLQSDLEQFKYEGAMMNKFISAVSYGSSGIEWIIPAENLWINAPKTRSEYGLMPGGNPSDEWTDFIKQMYALTSPDLDVSSFDLVEMETAHWQETDINQITSDITFESPSGKITKLTALAGGRSSGDWRMVHEYGHAWLGFKDLYIFKGKTAEEYAAAAGIWDLMNAYKGVELFAWHRFLSRWLPDDQIDCLGTSPIKEIRYISAIEDSNSKTKTVFVKISEGKILCIESRRNRGFDQITQEGVLVYVLDTAINNGQGPITTLSPLVDGKVQSRLAPGLLTPGDSLSYGNIKISNLASSFDGDLVSVEIG